MQSMNMPAESGEASETPSAVGPVLEYPLAWPGSPGEATSMPGMVGGSFACCTAGGGSTHELVYDRANGGEAFWVSGQMYDCIARVDLQGRATYHRMPDGSRPHGLAFDPGGQLWVTFEYAGQIARIDSDGQIIGTPVDVAIHSDQVRGPINPHPHGLGIGPDGTVWFTGKLSNTIGRLTPGGGVEHFVLPTFGAVPIYLAAEPAQAAGATPSAAMWFTELGAGQIGRVTPDGEVWEKATPTPNSRPIAIIPGPDGAMWFSEEAGGRIGRVDVGSRDIVEFQVPLTHPTAILAGLAFDRDGNLWVQQYLPQPGPAGDDYIVRFDRSLLDAPPGDLTGVPITFYKAPSQRTVMHRITQGPDGDIWFSELSLNRIGKVTP